MWQDLTTGGILISVFGCIFIIAGIFGKRFTGFMGQHPVSPWYGRAWLIGSGIIFLAYALAPSRMIRGSFGDQAQCAFFAIFKSYNGIGLLIVGCFVAFYNFRGQAHAAGIAGVESLRGPWWIPVCLFFAGAAFSWRDMGLSRRVLASVTRPPHTFPFRSSQFVLASLPI